MGDFYRTFPSIFGEGDAVNARRVDEPRRAITMSTPNGTRQMRATDSHGLLGWKQRYSTDLKMAHLDQLCSQFSRTASGLPLLRPDYRDRPPSAEPFVDKRDRMHQFMLNAASDGRGRSAKIPTRFLQGHTHDLENCLSVCLSLLSV